MDALLLTIIPGVLFVIAYFTYGRWLSRRVFRLRGDARTPAYELRDDKDYCPTSRAVVFGHHFTSIAGTGPIVGPAIAVMWGWLPAILWVVIGSVFMGAVHDFAALVVSLRNKGRSVGDIAGDLLGPRVRLIFLVILVVALWVVLAIFGLVIAAVLRQYPGAIFPVLVQIPLAMVIGLTVHRRGGNILIPSVIALVMMYASVVFGDWGPLGEFNRYLAGQPTIVWVAGLLVYAYIASVLPVWTLLQPRDYINALQLVTSLGLLLVGLVAAALFGGAPDEIPGVDEATRPALSIVAPMFNAAPEGAPPMIPILFITIACGAISGFHCLVSSGTTSKQLKHETDAQAVGYGSMLTEAFLATLVIVSCVAGLGLGITRPFTNLGVLTAFNGSEHIKSDFGSEQFRLKSDEWLHLWTFTQTTTKAGASAPTNPHTLLLRHTGKPEALAGWGVQTSSTGEQPRFYVDISTDDGGVQTDLDSAIVQRAFDLPGGLLTVDDEGPEYTTRGRLAWNRQYKSWTAAGSLGAKVGAFVDGAANLIKSIGIPAGVAIALMGVLVASFAGTTMDTACRLQRYVIQELARTFLPRRGELGCTMCGYDLGGLAAAEACPECAHDNLWRLGPDSMPSAVAVAVRLASVWNPFKWLATTHGATVFAVVSALALAGIPAPGQTWTLGSAGAGGLILWPLFGATNQLLGGLAFCVIGAWLIATRRPWWFVALPTVLMLILPAWAMGWQAFIGDDKTASWVANGDWLLVGIASVIMLLEAWLVAEVLLRLRAGIPDLPEPSATTTTDSHPTGCPPC